LAWRKVHAQKVSMCRKRIPILHTTVAYRRSTPVHLDVLDLASSVMVKIEFVAVKTFEDTW
jgi:hypothetical protein